MLFCALVAAFPALGFKDKKKASSEPFAIVSGTVFAPDGRALEGAEVSLAALGSDGSPMDGDRKLRTVSSLRGEFSFRVPVAPARYRVQVKASRYVPQTKEVAIEGEQRKELSFLLEEAGSHR